MAPEMSAAARPMNSEHDDDEQHGAEGEAAVAEPAAQLAAQGRARREIVVEHEGIGDGHGVS